MIYNSVSGAVVATLAACEKGTTKCQAWQKLFTGSEEGGGLLSLGVRSQEWDRSQFDYWIAARLHRLLKTEHWDALVAKYSTNKSKKIQAISSVRLRIASPAPRLFIYKAVTAWAIPKVKGKRREIPKTVMIEVPLDVTDRRRDALVSALVAARQTEKKRIESLEEDVIILADSFYDMNTWDLDAAPESTRRRWRADIFRGLDDLVNEALAAAEDILLIEGLMKIDARDPADV